MEKEKKTFVERHPILARGVGLIYLGVIAILTYGVYWLVH